MTENAIYTEQRWTWNLDLYGKTRVNMTISAMFEAKTSYFDRENSTLSRFSAETERTWNLWNLDLYDKTRVNDTS